MILISLIDNLISLSFLLISYIGNMLMPIESWRVVLLGMTVLLLIGAFLSLMFYLYVLIRLRRK